MKSTNLSALIWAAAIILFALPLMCSGQSDTRCSLPNGDGPPSQPCRWLEIFRLDLSDPSADQQLRKFIGEQLSPRLSESDEILDSCTVRYDVNGNRAFASVVCLAPSQFESDYRLSTRGTQSIDAPGIPLNFYRQVAQSAAGIPAPLNQDESTAFRKSVETINRRIRKSKCQGFLTVYFGRDIIEDISRMLDEHQAFSGPRSMGINVIDAGLYAEVDLARIHKLSRSWDTPVAQAASYEMGRSVGQLFADDNRTNGRSISAAVGKYNGNSNTAFYRKISSLIVLHEILHIVSGLADNPLAIKLGIDISRFHGDYELASAEITGALKRHGCG